MDSMLCADSDRTLNRCLIPMSFLGIIFSIPELKEPAMPIASAKPLTVRLKPDLYEAAARLSKQRRVSLNALVQESLARVVKEAEDRELYEAFEYLGQFPEGCDVEYAHAAQAEVALRVEFE